MVLKMVAQRTEADCTIVAIAMFLGETYEDVLATAAASQGEPSHHRGMWNRQMKEVANILGTELVEKHKWDEENAEGILVLKSTVERDDSSHVVVLKNGLIFDGDLSVWEPDVFFAHYNYKAWAILIRKE